MSSIRLFILSSFDEFGPMHGHLLRSIAEKMKFQLRGEFLNAFNHPQFANPNTDPANSNFGKTTSQSNLPRNVQIGLKMIF